MRIVSICSSHSFSRSRSMISIPAVFVSDDMSQCVCIHAFIIVFPGSLEGLRCFCVTLHKMRFVLRGDKEMRSPSGFAGCRGSCSKGRPSAHNTVQHKRGCGYRGSFSSVAETWTQRRKVRLVLCVVVSFFLLFFWWERRGNASFTVTPLGAVLGTPSGLAVGPI